ncbi:MAG: ATP-binding protein [bacterium]
MTNVIKFSSPHGEMGVSLRCEGEEILFAVPDLGSGIPALEIPQLFRSLRLTVSANLAVLLGAGLGLYWVE